MPLVTTASAVCLMFLTACCSGAGQAQAVDLQHSSNTTVNYVFPVKGFDILDLVRDSSKYGHKSIDQLQNHDLKNVSKQNSEGVMLLCSFVKTGSLCKCVSTSPHPSLVCNLNSNDVELDVLSNRLYLNCNSYKVDYDYLTPVNIRIDANLTGVVLDRCSLPTNLTFLSHYTDRLKLKELKVTSDVLFEETLHAPLFENIDVEKLYLSSISDIDLTADLFTSMQSLKSLDIHDSNVTLNGKVFDAVQSLEILKISGANLHELSDGLLDALINLKVVSFRFNFLETIPESLFSQTRLLETINLGFNKIHYLSEKTFENLNELQELNLEGINLTIFPPNLFGDLNRLKTLNLRHSTFKDDEPQPGIFRNLIALEFLDLGNSNLKSLPEGLFEGLSSLKILYLSENSIEIISPEVLTPLQSLKRLSLRENALHSISPTFSFSKHLTILTITGGNFENVPLNFIRNTLNFTRLNLSNNSIENLHNGCFKGIKETVLSIDLSRNRLGGITWGDAFHGMSRLTTLNLRMNNISTISSSLAQLIQLKYLRLDRNRIKVVSSFDMNFLGTGMVIDLSNNAIESVRFDGLGYLPYSGDDPNTFILSDNPLLCDCNSLSLRDFLRRDIVLNTRLGGNIYHFINIEWSEPLCSAPDSLRGKSLISVKAEQLLCPFAACPSGCDCQLQTSAHTILVQCTRMQDGLLAEELAKSFNDWPQYRLQVKAEHINLVEIGSFENVTANISSLDLSFNNISYLDPSTLPTGLDSLEIDHNNISHISSEFVDYFRNMSKPNRVLSLRVANNPLMCDCHLLPFYKFIKFDALSDRFRLPDVDSLSCRYADSAATETILSDLLHSDLCPGHTVLLVTGSAVLAVVACCLLALSLIYYRHGEIIRVWLYAHRLCLCWISEEEIDADKPYDAFISYSHLDEQFVVEQLVPQLEHGDPSFTLCLHYRDWLAGEWITDQIQRSVASSRRVIVVMSHNFVNSEWGRLEFIAAHKQALGDRTNRLIVIVYGALPDVSHMEHELQLYLTMNTYLQWGDPLFWQRLRYAMPHRPRKTGADKTNSRLAANVQVGNQFLQERDNKTNGIWEPEEKDASDSSRCDVLPKIV